LNVPAVDAGSPERADALDRGDRDRSSADAVDRAEIVTRSTAPGARALDRAV